VAGVYSFSTSGSGWYKLKAHDIFYVVDEDNAVTTLHAADNFHHEIHISGKLESSRFDWLRLSRHLGFNNCTASQQSSLKAAAASAKTYAANANSYFENNKVGTVRYTTWFGPYAASRRDVVSAHFRAINTNDFGGFTYDCSCSDSSIFAYVYPSTFVCCFILNYITQIYH
jgi:peptidyl-Lys metalloendopeptidase